MSGGIEKPLLVVLAGPNGAGKSTFFEAHLRRLGLPFLNADVLTGRTGLDAYAAADAIAAVRDGMVRRKEGFVIETVLSDPVGAKVRVMAEAVEAGFEVAVIYVGIASAALAQRRVAARVAKGGHDVPPEKIAARYRRSLDNLERALVELPRVLLYDNSSYEDPHRFLAEFRGGKVFRRGVDSMPEWARRFVP